MHAMVWTGPRAAPFSGERSHVRSPPSASVLELDRSQGDDGAEDNTTDDRGGAEHQRLVEDDALHAVARKDCVRDPTLAK